MKKIVVLTGCTSGIGRELCTYFAQDKNDLILVARDEKKLRILSEELSHQYCITIYPIVCDLKEKTSYQTIYQRVEELHLKVDILLNIAGFGIYEEFINTNIPSQQELLQVNIFSLMALCHVFGSKMKERRQGYIINFSSISGFFPGPYMSSYYASKAFILSFSIALTKELKAFGVKVLAICPGVIDTPFYKKANADKSASYLLFRMPPISVESFAKKAYKVIKQEKTYYKVIGIRNKLLIYFSFFIPKRILAYLLSWIQAKR